MVDGAVQTPSKRLRNSPNESPGAVEAASEVNVTPNNVFYLKISRVPVHSEPQLSDR